MTAFTPWGTVLITEVSSAAPDADFPTWVDISDYAVSSDAFSGRTSELTNSAQPGPFTLVLLNRDNRFTVGNTSSPYYPWWKQGRRIRQREIIAGQAFTVFDGYSQVLDNQINYEVPGATDSDIAMTVSGVDLLGRLQTSAKFISLLAAQILSVGKTAGLKAYYPFNDASLPFQEVTGNGYPPVLATINTGSSLVGTPSGVPAILPASTAMTSGDDTRVAAVTIQTVGAQDNGDVTLSVDYTATSQSIPILAGQTLTVAGWFNADPSAACTQIALLLTASLYQSGSIFTSIDVEYDASGATHGGNWYMHHGADPDLVATKAIISHWVPVALRFSWSPQTYEFWFADQPAQSGTWAGAPPANLSLAKLAISQVGFAGAIGHVQVYVGDPTAFTHTMWLAQIQTGLYGLERQTTGQRIATIAAWAGLPAGRLRLDPGVEAMQKPTVAGHDPLTELAEAADTERGRLFMEDGNLVFHDRRRVFNV